MSRSRDEGSSSSSGSGSEGGPPASFAWFHALDASLYAALVVASLYRCFLRWKSEIADPSTVASSSSWAAQFLQRYATFLTLIVYGLARSVVEALSAASYFDASFGTFEFNVVSSVPGALFALCQTAMISRWVRTVESIVLTMRYTRYKLGSVAVPASALLLGCFVGLLLVAFVDVNINFSPLSRNNWTTILNELEGVLYTFNGVCFVALGLQLAYFWKTVSEPAPERGGVGALWFARWRIAMIAFIFSGILIARGLLLCIGGVAQSSQNVGVILQYAVGPPAVLLVEWVCLVVCFFVLQPSRRSTQQSPLDNQFSIAMAPEINASSFAASGSCPDTPGRGPRRVATSPDSPRSRYAPLFGRTMTSSPQQRGESCEADDAN